jgi:hypothetical protein
MTFAKVLASAFKPATAITCVARTPSRETCSLSDGRVEAVEAVRRRDDALFPKLKFGNVRKPR